uniref:Uncharacterized protein n=1 Tax=Meloidogyne hapla TaxID=6305 RepID=A0A1I8BRT8_MELHA
MKIIGSNDVQKNEKGENNVDSTTPNIESSPPLMGIGHSTLISANLKNETKTDINLIKNNISNNNLLKTNTLRPTNLSLPPPTTSTTTKSLLLLTTTTPSSSSLLEPPPPSNNQSKSLPSSLLPSPSFNLPIPFCSDNSESSPSTSMAAATFLSNWRRQSTNKSKKGGDLIKIDKSVENNGIDGNNIKNNGYTLSELSHDVLAQIIRLFPFSSSLTTPTSSSTSSSTNSSSPSQRHIIYRALSQPNPTINTNLKCSSFNEEKKKKEENKSSLNINNNNEDILNNNNKISPKKQLLRDWHTRASSSSLGRKLRRAASTFSGSKIGGVSSKERPKNLSIFGKSEKNGKNAKSPTSCNGALSRLCKVSLKNI